MDNKKDEGVEYFANLMSSDNTDSEMEQGMLIELFQVLIIMHFKLTKKLIIELNKKTDGEYKELVKYTQEFPDIIVDAFVKRMNDSFKAELSKYNKMKENTAIGKMMGGLFSGMFDIDSKLEKYKKKIDEIAEMYRIALKTGSKNSDGEGNRKSKDDKEASKE